MTTRVSPEAYRRLLQSCADQGCSTYQYLRQLVHADVGLDTEGAVIPDPEEVQDPVQTELKVNGGTDEERIRILG